MPSFAVNEIVEAQERPKVWTRAYIKSLIYGSDAPKPSKAPIAASVHFIGYSNVWDGTYDIKTSVRKLVGALFDESRREEDIEKDLHECVQQILFVRGDVVSHVPEEMYDSWAREIGISTKHFADLLATKRIPPKTEKKVVSWVYESAEKYEIDLVILGYEDEAPRRPQLMEECQSEISSSLLGKCKDEQRSPEHSKPGDSWPDLKTTFAASFEQDKSEFLTLDHTPLLSHDIDMTTQRIDNPSIPEWTSDSSLHIPPIPEHPFPTCPPSTMDSWMNSTDWMMNPPVLSESCLQLSDPFAMDVDMSFPFPGTFTTTDPFGMTSNSTSMWTPPSLSSTSASSSGSSVSLNRHQLVLQSARDMSIESMLKCMEAGSDWLSCPLCTNERNKRFSPPGWLEHMRKHLELGFQCPSCSEKFSGELEMNRHLLGHGLDPDNTTVPVCRM